MLEIIKSNSNFDFMGRRRFFATVSITACLLSVIGYFVVGPKWGIDFRGGTEIQVAFKGEVSAARVRQNLKEHGFSNAEVVSFGAQKNEYLIRLQAISPVSEAKQKSSRAAFATQLSGAAVKRVEFSPGGDKVTLRLGKDLPVAEVEKAVAAAGLRLGVLSEAEKNAVTSAGGEEGAAEESSKRCESVTCTWPVNEQRVYEVTLESLSDRVMAGFATSDFGKGAIKKRSEWIGPKVGAQLRNAAIASLAYAMLFIMLYVGVRFDFRFAPGGVIALVHDVIITMGVMILVRIEVTLGTVAALLTIVGYSINDTIVVYDRIRENLVKIRERNLPLVVNDSINQTLSRTILTSLTTLLVVVVIMVMGWNTNLRDFAFALFVGIIVGTYSSIFIASPITVFLDQWFDRKKA